MTEEKPAPSTPISSSLNRDRVFRPGRKGAWHVMAHREYGVMWSHCGVVKTDPAGKKYRAYEGGTSFTVWLVWDETKNAKVLTARVRVVATDGKKRLKPAIVSAESR
jgi:hypothetical protein